jgi:hypothetical protein
MQPHNHRSDKMDALHDNARPACNPTLTMVCHGVL